MATLPKILWINWFQGWPVAPELVRACLNSWIARNPTWEVRALTNESLSQYINVETEFPGVRGKWLPPQAFSNLLRLALLAKYGGVWADSTLWCAQPLDAWLPEAAPEGFFAFSSPGPDRMISSWFLAARPGHPALMEWKNACNDYWTGRDSWDEYFWVHAMFARAYREGGALAATWDATPTRSALPPHRLQPLMNSECTEEMRQWLAGSDQPLYKLEHRVAPVEGVPSTLYREILHPSASEPADPLTKTMAAGPEVPEVTPGEGLIVVLGMHRSGTSALTEVLVTLGATLTPDPFLLPGTAGNERGHFEDARVVALNDWILEQHGASWLNPWPMRGAVPRPEEHARVRECWAELSAEGVNVVKDPRLCLTLPWWEPIWQERGPVSHVHIVRHPTQVARSLLSRDEMPTLLGELLWHEYVAAVVTSTSPSSVAGDPVVIRHEDLLRDPEAVAASLRATLGHILGPDVAPVHIPVDPGLQHQRSTVDATLAPVRELWSSLVQSRPSRAGEKVPRLGADIVALAGLVQTEWMRRRQADIDAHDARAVGDSRLALIAHDRLLLTDLRAVLGETHDRLTETTAQVADVQAAWGAEVEHLTHSKSWRWTAPLRAAQSRIRSLLLVLGREVQGK